MLVQHWQLHNAQIIDTHSINSNLILKIPIVLAWAIPVKLVRDYFQFDPGSFRVWSGIIFSLIWDFFQFDPGSFLVWSSIISSLIRDYLEFNPGLFRILFWVWSGIISSLIRDCFQFDPGLILVWSGIRTFVTQIGARVKILYML